MALASLERARLRRTLLWFALGGVGLATVLYIGGSVLGTFLARRPSVPSSVGSLKITAANDANADGSINRLNQDEHPVAALVTLTPSTGAGTVTLETDQAGFAALERVPIGSYQISAYVADVQVSVAPQSLTISSGATTQLSLALNPAGKILGGVRGTAYADSNDNGKIDAEDVPLAGAAVTLLVGGAAQQTSSTDDQGVYSFTALPAGSYLVRLEVPASQRSRFRSSAALSAVAAVRSSIDQRSVDFLLPLAPTAVRRPSYRLAASLSPGLEVTHLASDADQVDQEFVTTTPGSEVSFRATVAALGSSSDTYSNIVITADYPAGLRVHDVAGGGSDDGSAITWSLGTLSGGQTATFTYGATLDASLADGSYRSVVTATSSNTRTVDDDSTVLVRANGAAPAGQSTSESGTPATTEAAPTPTVGTSSVSVGVPAWQLALIVALPAVAILAVLVVGLRRARTQ